MNSKNPTIAEVVEEIFQSILKSDKKQRRMYSKTFWDKFGFKSRTQERIDSVSKAFRECSVRISIADKALGKEAKEDWIVLTYMAPEPPEAVSAAPGESLPTVPTPPDDWFEKMAHRIYESEREVEYYFIMPLLEQLGYGEDDIAVGRPVDMKHGSQKASQSHDGRVPRADIVVYDGETRSAESSLLTIEAKRFQISLDDKKVATDAASQARSYALWLATPYYILANGNDLHVYRTGLVGAADVRIVECHRTELRQKWPDIYTKLNRVAVVAYKAKIEQWMKAQAATLTPE